MNGTETIIELTDEQKIQILEKAKELLGPNGENWTKTCWFGVKRTEQERILWFEGYGYDPSKMSVEQMLEVDVENDYEASRKSLDAEDVEDANVWCLMGALEEVAYKLGIIPERRATDRLESPISLRALVQSKEEWMDWTVIDVNDNKETTFEMIRGLLDERLAQLKGETA